MAVLADWARSPGGWAPGVADASARPVGVVAVPSLARPHLVGSLARGIADIGRLPYLGTLTYTGPDGAHAVRRSNSAQRLRALSDAFAVSGELSGALAAASGPVLLVDDFTDSGWTSRSPPDCSAVRAPHRCSPGPRRGRLTCPPRVGGRLRPSPAPTDASGRRRTTRRGRALPSGEQGRHRLHRVHVRGELVLAVADHAGEAEVTPAG